jgi:Papain family cysteine protease
MAATGGHEYLRPALQLSVEHLWFHVAQRGGASSAGANFADVAAALSQDGQCSEAMWQYHPVTPLPMPNPPPTPSYVVPHAATSVARFDDVRAELMAGRPVVVGVRMNDEFLNGTSPIDAKGTDVSDNGLHAVLAVGFDDDRGVFTVRNSWGIRWGDKGYVDVTYDFMTRRSTRLLFLEL